MENWPIYLKNLTLDHMKYGWVAYLLLFVLHREDNCNLTQNVNSFKPKISFVSQIGIKSGKGNESLATIVKQYAQFCQAKVSHV